MKRIECYIFFTILYIITRTILCAYFTIDDKMLFETCKQRLGVTEESSTLLLLLLYYALAALLLLFLLLLATAAAAVVVIVTVHVLCTVCLFRLFSFSRSVDSCYVTYVSPKRRFNSINTYNRLHNLQSDSDLKIYREK